MDKILKQCIEEWENSLVEDRKLWTSLNKDDRTNKLSIQFARSMVERFLMLKKVKELAKENTENILVE